MLLLLTSLPPACGAAAVAPLIKTTTEAEQEAIAHLQKTSTHAAHPPHSSDGDGCELGRVEDLAYRREVHAVSPQRCE
jgi:hypothetical protein